MRKIGLMSALVGAFALILGGVALAGGRSGGPLTAGSPGHPQGLKLQMTFGWTGLNEANQPLITGIDVWFPKGSQYNANKYPRCSEATLNLRGPTGCPKGSIMGHGGGVAYADQTITRPRITVVNGGPKAVYFYTVLNNPARVQEAVVGHITRLHGRFIYHLSATIPQNLRIVAGVPIKLTSMTVTAGRAKWLATTNAPGGIRIMTTFDNGLHTSYEVWVHDS